MYRLILLSITALIASCGEGLQRVDAENPLRLLEGQVICTESDLYLMKLELDGMLQIVPSEMVQVLINNPTITIDGEQLRATDVLPAGSALIIDEIWQEVRPGCCVVIEVRVDPYNRTNSGDSSLDASLLYEWSDDMWALNEKWGKYCEEQPNILGTGPSARSDRSLL